MFAMLANILLENILSKLTAFNIISKNERTIMLYRFYDVDVVLEIKSSATLVGASL